MTRKEVAAVIKSIGLPFVYYAWKEKEAPELPYICYYYPDEDFEAADNEHFAKIARLNVELYTENKDLQLEDTAEAALDTDELSIVAKSSTYLQDEQMYETLYELEVIING